MTTPTRPIPVTLRKNLRRTLSRGHPWVYRDALDHPPHLADGTLVELRTGDRRAAGVGYWDGRSSIAVRMLSPGSLSDAEATLRERLRASLRLRLDRLDLRRTNAFRWVHGEADRLPGIHVDLYDDVAVVRFRNQDLAKEVNISEADIAKYYEAHKDELKTDETRKVQFVNFALNRKPQSR